MIAAPAVPRVNDAAQVLYDPRNGDLAFRAADLPGDGPLPQRTNYFTVCWVQEGRGTFWADAGCHRFGPQSLLFFVPYQNVRLAPEELVRGVVLQFHANFLGIETHHHEVGCNGVLFNDLYGVLLVELDERHRQEVGELVGNIRRELDECGLAHAELLLAYLKVLLVRASRLKIEQQGLRGARRPRAAPGPRQVAGAARGELPHPARPGRVRPAAAHDPQGVGPGGQGAVRQDARRADP